MTVVTRFAPSPTGYLHIGGARTALFNFLYARHMGGKFLLRIEDTDKARNTPEAVEAIHNGMRWLGLHSDEKPVIQSQRWQRHAEVARELVSRGYAYLDYTSQEEMDEARAQWVEAGNHAMSFRYKSPWRDQAPTGPHALKPHTIRLKAPREGATTIQDLVQGEVTVQNKELDDMILLRQDGSPVYMLAVVVDDYDMGVTHVIRGDDHLNNAFRQIPIYDGMGWERPTYAHIPLILDENGKKLSKRTGAAAVEDYRDDLGIRPEAMVNYLAKLGWGHGDDEIFTVEQAAEWFDIVDVNRNPARLDKKKLANINGHYIRQVPSHHLAMEILPKLHARGIKTPPFDTINGAMDSLKERSADMNALLEGTMFLWAPRPIQLAEPLSHDDKLVLARVYSYLQEVDFKHDSIMLALNDAAENLGIKLGKAVAPLRMALTGSKNSPPITDCLVLLGGGEAFARMRDAMS